MVRLTEPRELPIIEDENNVPEELAERMEICPSIPMFDLAGLATLAQWHGQQERGQKAGGGCTQEEQKICNV